jgi:hypothetical protein
VSGTISAARALPRSVLIVVLLYFAFQMTLCLTYDRGNPDAFLRGDRSMYRIGQVHNVLTARSTSEMLGRVIRSGLPGDYLWHAVVFYLVQDLPAPRLWVITIQILLATMSVFLVGHLAISLGLPSHASFLASALYATTPHCLVFPHMLLS